MKQILDRIAEYERINELFINNIRQAFNEIPDEQQRISCHGGFDTLLNLATYAKPIDLEIEFNKTLPQVENDSLIYMKNQLREINGVCTQTFSENHELYKKLFQGVVITELVKEEWRKALGASITKLIINKTTEDISLNFNRL